MTNKCFYCKRNEASQDYVYSHKMYFIHDRMKLWVGYKYSERKIDIPRCKECYDKHNNFATSFHYALLISAFAISVWICYRFAESLSQWIVGIIFFTLLIATPIWCGVEYFFFSKFMGIPREEEFDEFPLAEQMIKNGWVKSRPDPASFPSTGNEILDKQDKAEKT